MIYIEWPCLFFVFNTPLSVYERNVISTSRGYRRAVGFAHGQQAHARRMFSLEELSLHFCRECHASEVNIMMTILYRRERAFLPVNLESFCGGERISSFIGRVKISPLEANLLFDQ